MVERGSSRISLPPPRPRRPLSQDPRKSPTPRSGTLRDRVWCSIDNDDSRDLDQLSVAEPAPGGSAQDSRRRRRRGRPRQKGSAIDGHARTNTTSVYTAAAIFPMLPERLSTDLTSLNEGEERLALVIDMTVARDGERDRLRYLSRDGPQQGEARLRRRGAPGSRARRPHRAGDRGGRPRRAAPHPGPDGPGR